MTRLLVVFLSLMLMAAMTLVGLVGLPPVADAGARPAGGVGIVDPDDPARKTALGDSDGCVGDEGIGLGGPVRGAVEDQPHGRDAQQDQGPRHEIPGSIETPAGVGCRPDGGGESQQPEDEAAGQRRRGPLAGIRGPTRLGDDTKEKPD